MNETDTELYWLIGTIIVIFSVLLLIRLAFFINDFSRELKYLNNEIGRTTCAISGTFAKYVTTESGSDFARVAKWGVEIEAESFDMFTTDYETDDEDATFTGKYSVSSAAADERDDVLAPGTEGSFANIAITGTPEVAVDVAVVATVTASENWTVDGAFYCPVTITVGTTEISGLDYDSATAFATAIKTAIDGKSAQYAPNTNLATTYDNTNLDLAWSWAFEGAANGELDTMLGNLATEQDLIFTIVIKTTATESDNPYDDSGITPPQTGDNTNLALWITLAASSFAVMMFLLFFQNKEKRRYDAEADKN